MAAVTLLSLAVAGCSKAASSSSVPTPVATKSADSLRAVAEDLAAQDHTRRVGPYLRVLSQLARRCHSPSPAGLEMSVSADYDRLTSHGPRPGSVLSVMRVLAVRANPNGPPNQCERAVSDLLREVTGLPGSGPSYAGFGASLSAFAAAHRRDPKRSSSYLPRLPDGRDSYVVGGVGQVTTVGRAFDPPLPQSYALAVIRRQLLPAGKLDTVYSLSTAHCSETIYLNPVLGAKLGSSASGVMIELTSGRGVSSRFDPDAVNRARLSVGGRIGGQPCV